MGLMDDIRDEQGSAQYIRCPVARAMAALGKDDAADLTAALADHNITNVAIARALARHGISARADAISNHRRESCACPRV
jgi:hypothetical protein